MRYSFRINHRRKTFRHHQDLPDTRAATAEALVFAAGLLRDPAVKGDSTLDIRIEVSGTGDVPLFAVRICSEEARDDDESEAHPS